MLSCPYYLCVRTYTFSRLELLGRLGNQLWQVAAVLGSADKESRAFIPPDWAYRWAFSLPEKVYQPPEGHITDLSEPSEEGPYYQRLKHLKGVPIRRYFAPSERGEAQLRARHARLLDDPYPLCALHVRRGDYVQNQHRFPLLTSHYYEQAAKVVLDVEPATRFLVFSDDISWCKQNPDLIGAYPWPHEFIDGDVVPIPPTQRTKEPTDVLDMFLMSRCSAIIMANSTFSWWAARLSHAATIVYPDVWFGPDVETFTGFPKGWVRVET